MMQTIYVEEAVREYPLARKILNRFPDATAISCARYGEVFNPTAQNFRLQKRRPALILAEKFANFVLEAPPGYGIGGDQNFYFSHMLNCIYDCRYCFLQGMYRSAHYVVFVNYEAFQRTITDTLRRLPGSSDVYFFSGYDCDSLALEPITGFARSFLPFFAERSRAILELRTKSVQIRSLLETEPFPNCVVAFSFTPEPVSAAVEHKVPPTQARVRAMEALAARGWLLGLRFDPLVYHSGYRTAYRALFRSVFEKVPVAALHSVSVGPLRFPRHVYARVVDLYPDEPLLAATLTERDGIVSYPEEIEEEMAAFCESELAQYVPAEILFPQVTASGRVRAATAPSSSQSARARRRRPLRRGCHGT